MKISTAYIEITNQCNLNCATCYNRSGTNLLRRELSFSQIEGIIATLLPLGTRRFLFSGGEPTLHTEFDKVLSLIDTHSDLSFGIVTNATTGTKSLADAVNSHSNLTLQISLDGACEETNALTRGKGNFEKAMEFARSIRNTGGNPLLKMVISKNNYEDIERFYLLARSLGFTPEFAYVYRSGNGSDDWENKALTAREKFAALKLIERLNTELECKAFLPRCTVKCPLFSAEHTLSVCIKVDGSIQPCQGLYDGKFTVGNILSFDKNEFDDKMAKIVSLAKERVGSDFSCSKCILRDTCGKGCMANADQLTGNPLGDDDGCEFRKLQFVGCGLTKSIREEMNGQV